MASTSPTGILAQDCLRSNAMRHRQRSAHLEEVCQIALRKLLQLCHLSSLAIEDEGVVINFLPLTRCQLEQLLWLFQLGLDKLLHL